MPDEREWTIARRCSEEPEPLMVTSGSYNFARPIVVVPKSTREAAEAERDEAKAWAASSENPAFDAGWSAGQKRANIDLQREVERLREALSGVANQACREWVEDKANYCYEPAEFVLWGKLVKPEALGPRCYDHAAKHIGHEALRRGANFALIDLRKAHAALSPREDAK